MNSSTAQHAIVVDELPADRRSLRIAVVTETYPPDVNGAALTLQRLVEGLRSKGHGLQLVRLRQDAGDEAARGGQFNELLLRGCPIPRYPHLKMGLPSKRALVAQWSLRRPDLVHIATEGLLGWSALQAATRLKLPVCSEFRTNFHAYSRHYDIGWLRKPILAYLRKFHNRTQATMVPTEGLRQELEGHGFHRMAVIGRGVDTQRFSPHHRSEALRAEWGAAPGAPVLVCVGRLAAEKNLDTVIEAFAAVQRMDPRARCVLVGDGPLRESLAGRVPGLILAGQRKGEDLARHYASGDLFVFPSLTETWGNVTGEAMASGLAVLAYDYAAAAQLIRCGHNGVRVRVDDRAGFVKQAVALAARPEQLRELGANAFEASQQMGWPSIVDQVEQVYLRALDSVQQSRDSLRLATA